jgi:hypothetical protein
MGRSVFIEMVFKIPHLGDTQVDFHPVKYSLTAVTVSKKEIPILLPV